MFEDLSADEVDRRKKVTRGRKVVGGFRYLVNDVNLRPEFATGSSFVSNCVNFNVWE